MNKPIKPIKRGYSYPLRVEGGNLALSEDYDLIREFIFSVLETRWFERVMRPSYGTPDYVFEAIRDPSAISEQVLQALETQVIGVSSWRVFGEADESGVFRLTVEYGIGALPQPPIKYSLQY